jgi:hypothetical protein
MNKKAMSLDQFDLGTKSNEGVDIELKNPVNGQGLGIFITVVGRYSERYQAAVREVSNQSIKVAANKKEKMDIVTEANERGTQLLARSTLGWRTDDSRTIFFHGKDQQFSFDAAIELYKSVSLPWVKEQVDAAVHSNANFMTP